MAGKVIGKNLNLGYAGKVSRDADVLIENRIVSALSTAIPFGAPVVLNTDNTYSMFGAASAIATFGGIAVAGVKQATNYYDNEVEYLPNQPCDVLVRGTATIICKAGTPTAGGKVFVTIAEDPDVPDVKIGDFVAKAHTYKDEENNNVVCTVEITNAKWTTGYIDANDVAEVTLLTRVNP